MTPRVRCAGVLVAAASIAAVTARPACADVQKALGDLKAGRYLEAVGELQAVVDRSPGYANAYFLLGHCMLRMNKPGDAEEQFKRAIALDPSKPEYYQGLAVALKSQANWIQSIQIASDGLARTTDPELQLALLGVRGLAYGAVGRWNEAARDLETARKIRPAPWLSVPLGKAYFGAEEYERAVVPLREALEAAPDDYEVLRLLTECFIQRAGAEPDPARKRVLYVDALAYARRTAGVRPNDLDAIYLVGRASLGAGELELAERLFRTVLSRQPRQCYAMVNLGRTYIALERWREAEAFLNQAAACAPRMPVVFETLGDLYLRVGQPQKAAEAYQRADEIDPEVGVIRPPFPRPVPPNIPVRNPR